MKVVKDQIIIVLSLSVIIFAAKLVSDRFGQDKNESEAEKR